VHTTSLTGGFDFKMLRLQQQTMLDYGNMILKKASDKLE